MVVAVVAVAVAAIVVAVVAAVEVVTAAAPPTSRGMHLKTYLGTPWGPRYDNICKHICFYKDHSGYQRLR